MLVSFGWFDTCSNVPGVYSAVSITRVDPYQKARP